MNAWLALSALLAAVTAVLATEVRVLPPVIDISIIPTVAGTFSILSTSVGALCRFPPDRIGRLSMFGTTVGGGFGTLILMLAVVEEAL